MESEKKYRTETHQAGYLVVSNGVEIETRKACEERVWVKSFLGDTLQAQNFITFMSCYRSIGNTSGLFDPKLM